MNDIFDNGIRLRDNGDSGNGRHTLVLLHGLGNSLEMWNLVYPHLVDKFRVISLDLPGFGKSLQPLSGLAIDGIVDQVGGLLAQRGVTEASVIAHSLGGYVALSLAKTRPSLVKRLILVSAALLEASDIVAGSSNGKFSTRIDLAAQFIGASIPLNERSAALIFRWSLTRRLTLWPFVAQPASIQAESLRQVLVHNGGLSAWHIPRLARSSPSLRSLMAGTRHEAHLLTGSKDRLISQNDLSEASELLHASSNETIRGCGHWPMVECPARLVGHIREILVQQV